MKKYIHATPSTKDTFSNRTNGGRAVRELSSLRFSNTKLVYAPIRIKTLNNNFGGLKAVWKITRSLRIPEESLRKQEDTPDWERNVGLFRNSRSYARFEYRRIMATREAEHTRESPRNVLTWESRRDWRTPSAFARDVAPGIPFHRAGRCFLTGLEERCLYSR